MNITVQFHNSSSPISIQSHANNFKRIKLNAVCGTQNQYELSLWFICTPFCLPCHIWSPPCHISPLLPCHSCPCHPSLCASLNYPFSPFFLGSLFRAGAPPSGPPRNAPRALSSCILLH